MRVTAIIASHNRRASTLKCLASFFAQEIDLVAALDAVLVDDGSIDGTAEAVRNRFPETQVISGTGDLFWAGAMEIAERVALKGDPDYLLWLNDDVVLDPNALAKLIQTATAGPDGCIAVGALRDPGTGELTYSGVRRRGLHPLRMNLVPPTDKPVEVETFNGNAVLVPRLVAERVGHLDGTFEHAAADYDYGLRAAEAGHQILLAPGTLGGCRRDSTLLPWADRSLARRQRLRILLGPKGVPLRPRLRYLRRHGGVAWPLFFVASYVRAAPSVLRSTRAETDTR